MAMPHDVQFKIIKEKIKFLEGKVKINEINKIISELPYNSGPYGKMKEWLRGQIKVTKTRSKVKHNEAFGVKRQGHKQFTLVGMPNIGKSSLLANLSGLQTKVANYEFTTLEAIPAVIKINNAEFQIVDLPGLIQGASENIGEGRRFLGVVRNSDGIMLMHDLTKDISDLNTIISELEKAKIQKPILIVGTKLDISEARDKLETLKKQFSNYRIIGISNETRVGYEKLKQELWNMSDLIRVYRKEDKDPFILKKGSTVKELVLKIHKELLDKFKFAKIVGESVKYPNQQVGLYHEFSDKDLVELSFSL
jgi:uncharacterized protein